uniref:Peroxisomal ATPase PEX1 n=1 Tax=Anabas testudineus TaxID=64144 RepID=A0A7N6AIF5_ANATE
MMFSNQGIQPVTVVFNNTKNCFLQLPSKLISHLSLNENQALELSWVHGNPVFLSWTQNRTSSCLDSHQVALCRQLGEKLGLKDGEQGFLRPCHQVSSVHQVFVEPLTSDDWEILELHSAALEQHLLDQIRVVFQDAVFPVWVDSHTAIYIQIASLLPSVPYGRLEQFTELVVSPKIRTGIGTVSGSVLRTSEKQPLQRQQQSDLPFSSLQHSDPVPQSHQWGGIADLKSLLHYMIKGSYDPVKEQPPVPDIPAFLTDSIYRVCDAPPYSLCTISHVTTGVIHLFPLHGLNSGLYGGHSQVTYGTLSKVPSPKERRDRAKQAMEKKKNTQDAKVGASKGGEDEKDEEVMVVRVVCHGLENLTVKQKSSNKGEIHSGRVWVSVLSYRVIVHPFIHQFTVTQTFVAGVQWFAGSGKSSLSRALCRKAREVLDAHIEVVDCKKLQGKRAETVRQMLQDIFEQAEWRQPSVILLDDLDHVTGAPTSPEHEHGPEALLQQHIAQSLKDVVDEVVVHSSLVCLIITSHSEHSLHPSLTEIQGSHFIQGFAHIQPPDQAQRTDILRHLILRKSCVSEETLQTLDLGPVAKETEGYTPQDLALLLKRAVHANTTFITTKLTRFSMDFTHALKGFTPPSLWGVDLHTPSGVGLERVGGLREVRQQLMDTILLPAKYPVLFSNLPIRHCSGILLYGAPGTGKTLLARAVAKDSGMNFISIKGPELLSKYIGASEQGVRDTFQRAQAAKPCILFFDEFDALAPRRGHDSTGVTDRVVNQLLTQLDGVEGLQGVYVLAATSRPDLIDPALLRPGRLDKSLYCPPPDREARVEILKALSVGVLLAADVDLEQLAAATEQFTGADLKALLYNAQLEAIHNSLSSGTPHLTSGSDSDMSLSSMIFPNNSSGSDDSVGEGDICVGLEQSVVLLETNEIQADEQQLHGNVWRLYFGSSYEEEIGNSPISGLNSQCASGPNSITHDCTGASVPDPNGSLPPAFMPSLQSGYKELGLEQLDHLQQDINNIKNNYRRVHSASSQPGLLLCWAHINSALAVTRPSLSKSDWKRYTNL